MNKSVLSSMTGFAREEGALEALRWIWEIKSVNGRGLELRFRMPSGFEELELALRKRAATQLKRGSVSIALSLDQDNAQSDYQINEAALEQALGAIEKIGERIACAPPQAEGLLALRGVMEPKQTDAAPEARAALTQALSDSFDASIAKLQSARASEGAELMKMLSVLIDDIEKSVVAASEHAGLAPQRLRQKIKTQLSELLAGEAIPEDRLAQEAALLAVKADIREEIDRLNAHIKTARDYLAKGGPAGRQLDFLTQEFNREANTLCAKAPDMDIKTIGLALKQSVDQLREQVQNVE